MRKGKSGQKREEFDGEPMMSDVSGQRETESEQEQKNTRRHKK